MTVPHLWQSVALGGVLVLACAPAKPAAADRPVADPVPEAQAPASIPVTEIDLATAPGYPVWLESGGVRTDQTSGIAFVETTPDGTQWFFTCDDVGAFHRLEIREAQRPAGITTGDGWLTIAPIAIPKELRAAFGTGPAKLDLEEVCWVADAHTPGVPAILVSVEGNRLASEETSDPRAHERRIEFCALALDAPLASATTLTRVDPFLQAQAVFEWPADWQEPWTGFSPTVDLPLAGMVPNRSFEGVAMGGARQPEGGPALLTEMWWAPEEAYPADPLIPVAWQGTLPLFYSRQLADTGAMELRVQQLPATVGLSSVCGLTLSADGSELYVLDRNRARIQRCALDGAGGIIGVTTAILNLKGPSGESYLVPSLESLTLDDSGHLWAVVDPWKYFPASPSDNPLPQAELRRYRDLVPLLYKFVVWG